jgi:hypothetical protein
MVALNGAQWSSDQIDSMEALAGRVANSPQLQGSPKLREFLQYVVACALRKAPEEATEQQIGVHVFHRQPGYNSGDDSIVRTQARLLRTKVNAYFANEGCNEPILIEIPKGQYFPVFRTAGETQVEGKQWQGDSLSASSEDKTANAEQMKAPLPDAATTKELAHVRRRWLGYGILCAVSTLLLGLWAGYLWREHQVHPATPELDAFWKPFYATNSALVIYNNPTFIGNPTDGLRFLRQDAAGSEVGRTDQRQPLDETYAGTGEVEAIHILTALFDAHGVSFTLKRSKLVTWDEARSRSLLFIGRSEPEKRLRDLQPLTQFYMTETPDHRNYIVNLHPHAGEPATFPMQSPTRETAVVALLPGLQPETRVAVFSGLSTVGTQEAVDFLTQPSSIQRLIDTVGTDNRLLKPFEAVLRIDTSAGVAMNASFLAIHRH